MSKKIRSKVVKESLLDYNTLANSLKENTESAVKNLLGEAVRDTYAKLLSEGDDEDYEEDEVKDTQDSDVADDAESVDDATDDVDDADAGMDSEEDGDAVDDDELGDDEDIDFDDEDIDAAAADIEAGEDSEDDSDEWAEFDKYKVSDDEYDFSDAEDEEIVKVYKLMKNDDQILVHKDDNGNVNIQDNETGAEYLINIGGGEDVDDTDDFSAEDDFENDIDDMNESTERMFELVLEYDSNVGYTDNYQKKDVMTNPGMSEPGKNVNDWDAGVPKGDAKPWSGYPSKKNKADKPFNAGKGKQLEEEEEDFEEAIEEAVVSELKTVGEHGANNLSTSRTDGPNNPRNHKGRSFHTAQRGQETGTGDNPYQVGGGNKNVEVEGVMRKVNKTLKENKELKGTLTNVMTSLKEAAVTNHNLAQIIKLISENSTTQDEKKEIIGRFAKEAKTIDASKALYESISNDLKKTKKMNISEGTVLSAEGSKKINETTIYKSPDVLESLDLMHRMM